jgi:sugar fermentation stimulation protein A
MIRLWTLQAFNGNRAPMLLPQPMLRGVLVARYKRFFADVALDDGRAITAHCPNPGSMLGMKTPGHVVWVSRSDDPKRKLAHTLELVEVDGALIGVNTMLPNRLVAEALAAGAIPELAGYASVRREVKYGEASRVDFLLEAPDRPACWVEVKSVTLCRAVGLAEWPDSVSARGARHIAELEAVVARGDRAVVLFLVQRSDCDRFALASDLDPAFSRALERAVASGVEVLAYGCEVGPERIGITGRVPLNGAG